MGSQTPPAATQSEFRKYLPNLDTPRFTTLRKQDAHEYARGFLEDGQPPWLFALYKHWRQLFEEPFHGVTSDGHVRNGLFTLEDEGFDVGPAVEAARSFLDSLTAQQRQSVKHHIDSPEWRSWSNPEFLISDKGVRLDEVGAEVRRRALDLLRSCTSEQGYAKALAAMRINGFLGRLVGGEKVMNEFSYNVVVFGQPSVHRPWGWAIYGHHLCLNAFVYRRQIVLSPWFTGAEPNLIDDEGEDGGGSFLSSEGKIGLGHGHDSKNSGGKSTPSPSSPSPSSSSYRGTRILDTEECLGLKLMQSLPPHQQSSAQIYKQLHDPAMPPGRWNKDDQRHLCGAYRDNRIVPYEGIRVSDMSDDQRDLVWAITEQYLLYLPDGRSPDGGPPDGGPRAARMRQVKEHVGEMYFCWIGGFADEDAFYYRLQSPVIIMEFDHHSGVFLTNEEPAKFHIHTILRTPNAGDYGMALRPLIPAPEDKFLAVL